MSNSKPLQNLHPRSPDTQQSHKSLHRQDPLKLPIELYKIQ